MPRMSHARAYDGFAIDLDGVVWLAGVAIPGSADAVAGLRRAGHPVVFVTNDPGRTRAGTAALLEEVGIEATPEDVITSSAAVADAVRSELGRASVFMIGPDALQRELELAGLEVVGADRRPVDAVAWVGTRVSTTQSSWPRRRPSGPARSCGPQAAMRPIHPRRPGSRHGRAGGCRRDGIRDAGARGGQAGAADVRGGEAPPRGRSHGDGGGRVGCRHRGGPAGAAWPRSSYSVAEPPARNASGRRSSPTSCSRTSPRCATRPEKQATSLRLRIFGRAGHASVPARADNPVRHAATAIERLASHETRPSPGPATARALRALGAPGDGEDAIAWAGDQHPLLADLLPGMTRMTITPTGLETFEPANVIPPFADVICDCRALPEQTEADIREHVARALGEDGPRYELDLLEPLEGGTESPSTPRCIGSSRSTGRVAWMALACSRSSPPASPTLIGCERSSAPSPTGLRRCSRQILRRTRMLPTPPMNRSRSRTWRRWRSSTCMC